MKAGIFYAILFLCFTAAMRRLLPESWSFWVVCGAVLMVLCLFVSLWEESQ